MKCINIYLGYVRSVQTASKLELPTQPTKTSDIPHKAAYSGQQQCLAHIITTHYTNTSYIKYSSLVGFIIAWRTSECI